MTLNFVSLAQRTPEWHEWRRNGITATESPMIAGISPYCSAWHLWGEKTGKLTPHSVSEFAVRNGIAFESTALDHWNGKHDEMAMPACVEWSQDRKYRASCDGLTASNLPVEIKCFGKEHLAEIGRLGLSAPSIRHCVMQVHHQIMVTEADKGFLVFYDADSEEKIHEFEIGRDEEVIKGIISRGDEFWQYVQSGKEPPYPRDIYTPKGKAEREEWAVLARDYREHEQQLLLYEAAMAEHRSKMEEISNKLRRMMPEDQNLAQFGGVIVQRIPVKGQIDWKKAYQALPEDKRQSEADLEGFRRKMTEKWSIKTTANALPEDVLDESLVNPILLEPVKSYWF